MAKAATNIITWILLRDAKARVTEVYGSPQLAERLLVEWLAAGRLRWSCKRIDARVPKGHPLATRKDGAVFWGRAGILARDEAWRYRRHRPPRQLGGKLGAQLLSVLPSLDGCGARY